MQAEDSLQRFIFDNHPIHGMMVRLNTTYQTVLAQCAYPPLLRQLLGEALVCVTMLSGLSKQAGKLTLQFQGDGELKLLSVRCTHDFQLRGIAKWEGDISSQASLSEALGQGTLVLTYEPEGYGERYQSAVQVQGHSMADAIEAYFQQSEQRSARLILALDGKQAVGLMLQTLPAEQEDKDLSFEHVVQLANTLHGDELLKLDNATILHRLYHQEVVRTFTSQPLRFGCSCSLARMENALLGIGKEEAMSILAERAYIEVTCEFCHRQYQFDQIEIEKLFKRGTSSIEQPPTKH